MGGRVGFHGVAMRCRVQGVRWVWISQDRINFTGAEELTKTNPLTLICASRLNNKM